VRGGVLDERPEHRAGEVAQLRFVGWVGIYGGDRDAGDEQAGERVREPATDAG
jgi:hypothetical protein